MITTLTLPTRTRCPDILPTDITTERAAPITCPHCDREIHSGVTLITVRGQPQKLHSSDALIPAWKHKNRGIEEVPLVVVEKR